MELIMVPSQNIIIQDITIHHLVNFEVVAQKLPEPEGEESAKSARSSRAGKCFKPPVVVLEAGTGT